MLKQRAREVEEIDGDLVTLVHGMYETMDLEDGIGLAAPQVGVRKRLFVYDVGDGPQVVINPVVVEGDGEWTYEEGCLSVPGLSWEIVRPRTVHLTGLDLDGNELSIDADELLARLFQHETDHLDGVLLLQHLDAEQRRDAHRELRERQLEATTGAVAPRRRLRLPGRSASA